MYYPRLFIKFLTKQQGFSTCKDYIYWNTYTIRLVGSMKGVCMMTEGSLLFFVTCVHTKKSFPKH